MKSFYHVHMIALYYSVSFYIYHSHTSCQVRDDSVSHKTKNRKNKQTYFFQFQWNAQRQPHHIFFFYPFSHLFAFIGMTVPWHLFTYGDIIRHLYDAPRKREREREREDQCVFLFLLCATGVPSILRCIF